MHICSLRWSHILLGWHFNVAGLATKAQTAKRPSVLSLGGSFSTHGKKKLFWIVWARFSKDQLESRWNRRVLAGVRGKRTALSLIGLSLCAEPRGPTNSQKISHRRQQTVKKTKKTKKNTTQHMNLTHMQSKHPICCSQSKKPLLVYK